MSSLPHDPKDSTDNNPRSVFPRLFIVVFRSFSRQEDSSEDKRKRRLELWATILKILAALAALFRALR